MPRKPRTTGNPSSLKIMDAWREQAKAHAEKSASLGRQYHELRRQRRGGTRVALQMHKREIDNMVRGLDAELKALWGEQRTLEKYKPRNPLYKVERANELQRLGQRIEALSVQLRNAERYLDGVKQEMKERGIR